MTVSNAWELDDIYESEPMEVYLVIGYFKYEGCEPICICSTLEKAIALCKEKVGGYDGTEVIKYILDISEEGVDVHKEINRV